MNELGGSIEDLSKIEGLLLLKQKESEKKRQLLDAFDFRSQDIRAHLDQRFPRFVYHDGIFESLDDRKKENLLAVIRAYADIGIQSVITLIDSDLPPRTEKVGPVFTTEELILTLHDENEQGRLFRMKPW